MFGVAKIPGYSLEIGEERRKSPDEAQGATNKVPRRYQGKE